MKHLNHWPYRTVKLLFALLFLSFTKSRGQTQHIDITVVKTVSTLPGYHASKPVNYGSNPTKQYPLLIALHGSGERGDGSATDLNKLFQGGTVPYMLTHNTFPDSVEVDGEIFSFIVVCPQYSLGFGAKPFIEHLKTEYRIDTNRIYFTGLSEGAAKAWHNLHPNSSYPGSDAIAAMVLASPSIYVDPYLLSTSSRIDIAHTSNLPLWVTQNVSEGTQTAWVTSNLRAIDSNFNGRMPAPQPLAKLQVFPSSGHNSWVKVYNPANIIDSANGYNIYQWMLQYTNKKLIAKAGRDTTITLPADSITLNGSKSTVRQGRFGSILWSKVAGPSTFTITSSTSFITSVTGLVAGTYQFELKLNHSDGSTVRRDTVTITVNADTSAVQTLTARPDRTEFGTGITGFYESLPVDYSTSVNRKYPLLIALHGWGEKGNGSLTELERLINGEGTQIPKLIASGEFPTSFNVNGENFSFIVICPQLPSTIKTDSVSAALKKLLEYCKAHYRVDPERIYMTGLRLGSTMQWDFVSREDDITSSVVSYRYADSIAAITSLSTYLYPASSYDKPYRPTIVRVSTSNLPVFAKHNAYDSSASKTFYSYGLADNLNGTSPVPSPLARYDLIYPGNGYDAWTLSYDPDYIFDSSAGLNIYKWMLQYTNKKLVANAGNDKSISTSTSTLDGSKSTARRGRITKYAWTKISGGSVTVASDTNAVTGISGLSNGTYQFQLQITHTDSTTAKDTVTITVSGVSPRVAAPVVEVAQPAMQTDELLSAKINPTVAQSQVTVVITGRAMGKANLQISSMDGKRLQRQSFVKDGTTTTRTVNVSSMPAGTYIVEIIVGGKHRKILRFVKQ